MSLKKLDKIPRWQQLMVLSIKTDTGQQGDFPATHKIFLLGAIWSSLKLSQPCCCAVLTYLKNHLISPSYLPSCLKTMKWWPQFWLEALVPQEDRCFCPKPAFKWFSLILLWRWVNPNQTREHPAWGTDVGLLVSLPLYPNSVVICDMFVCHLPRWSIGPMLNIGNILKIGHRQVGVLCLLFNILLIWPVLIFISCFICSHQFASLHFPLSNHILILSNSPKQHLITHLPQPRSSVVHASLFQLE